MPGWPSRARPEDLIRLIWVTWPPKNLSPSSSRTRAPAWSRSYGSSGSVSVAGPILARLVAVSKPPVGLRIAEATALVRLACVSSVIPAGSLRASSPTLIPALATSAIPTATTSATFVVDPREDPGSARQPSRGDVLTSGEPSPGQQNVLPVSPSPLRLLPDGTN